MYELLLFTTWSVVGIVTGIAAFIYAVPGKPPGRSDWVAIVIGGVLLGILAVVVSTLR